MASILPIYVLYSFVISFIIVAAAVGVARRLVRRSFPGTRLSDIIRDDDWYPSLALFQFTAWTLIIATLYLAVYFMRFFAGVSAFPQSLPANLLTLMGLSTGTTVVNGAISSYKYAPSDPTKRPTPLPKFGTMMEEGGKPTLTRFQMFTWTLAGIAIYLGIFATVLLKPGTLQSVESLSLPDIDPILVVLMGLSQGTYVGGKVVMQVLGIAKILPETGAAGQLVSIFGTGFGDVKDTVWFGNTPVTAQNIGAWTGTRIDLNLPAGISAGTYDVRVAVGGGLSPASQYTIK